MNFLDAMIYKMKFGKYAGKTLDEIAQTDEGLKYLDYLYGQTWLMAETRDALATYIGEPSIAKEVAQIFEENE